AIIVAGRQLDGQVDHAQLLVDADLPPNAGVARVVGRIFLPSVAAEFADARDGVENPEPLARADVISANEAFLVAFAFRLTAGAMGRADDDGVAGNRGRGVQTHFARHQVHLLIVFQLQIHNARGAKARHLLAG